MCVTKCYQHQWMWMIVAWWSRMASSYVYRAIVDWVWSSGMWFIGINFELAITLKHSNVLHGNMADSVLRSDHQSILEICVTSARSTNGIHRLIAHHKVLASCMHRVLEITSTIHTDFTGGQLAQFSLLALTAVISPDIGVSWVKLHLCTGLDNWLMMWLLAMKMQLAW